MSSEFTVTAMDADELKRSQRKYSRKGDPHHQGHVVQSQESDLDDEEEDEVSTPSADTGDKNMMSILSVRYLSFCYAQLK